MSKQAPIIYRITFYNQNTIYEIYAKYVSHEAMFGFVEVGELVFGSTSDLLVDPAEERLKNEFSGVKTTYIPVHAVLRIDVVEKEGVSKVREVTKGSNVAPFPVPIYPNNTPPSTS